MNRTLRFQRYLATAVMSLLVLSACQHETISLRHALNAAGNNRAELEAMLEHYRTIDNDPQKLAAAQFIITNMPAHYSYHDNRIEKYYDAAYTILNTQDKTPVWQRDTLLAINDALFTTNPPQATPDAQTISSDYLIENIDKAFIQWRTLEWTRHLTFEEFCEWLLPYKIAEGQTLDAWRDTLYENIKPALYSMIPDDDEYQTVRKTTDIVRNRLNTIVKRYGLYSRSGLPLMRSDLYLHYTFGDIPDWVRLATLTYRYWRYLSPHGSYGSTAELTFFDADTAQVTIRNHIASTDDAVAIQRAFDGDWLTNFETGNPDGNWVGADIGKPSAVCFVRIVPRSDDNDIHPGDTYEFRYWSQQGNWVSRGITVATDNELHYDSIPSGALMWLSNHTRGWDERAFLIDDNGNVEWW